MADLVEAPDSGLTARTFGDQQGPHRFHRPVAGLGDRSTATPECRSGRFDRVELIGLAVAATLLPVRAIDLDHFDPGALQKPGQPGAVGAGALDPDPGQLAEAGEPVVQVSVAGGCRRKRLDTQHTAVAVQSRRDMHIEVRVDTTGDRTRALYDGHRHPFSLQLVKGWHARPGKETVNDHAVPAARSVTLRNGACPVTTRSDAT